MFDSAASTCHVNMTREKITGLITGVIIIEVIVTGTNTE